MTSPMRVAVVGSGPAGIYASDLLVKSDVDVQIDLFEKMPAPFGLIRYGVAPDHPRIKGIVQSLHNIMEKEDIRFLGNIEVGKDITVTEMRDYYDAIIFATGATGDRDLNIPGIDLEGSRGAAEFVAVGEVRGGERERHDRPPSHPWPRQQQRAARRDDGQDPQGRPEPGPGRDLRGLGERSLPGRDPPGPEAPRRHGLLVPPTKGCSQNKMQTHFYAHFK